MSTVTPSLAAPPGSSSQVPPAIPPPPDRGPSPDSKTSASNLYLVTFLATLFLLLFISCAIILRSYILRRRYMRHLEVALGAGMLLTPRSQGSKHARFGHVPKLYNAWVVNGGEKWKDMHPLAAQPVFVKRKRKEATPVQSTGTGQPPPPTLEMSNTLHTNGTRSLWSRFRPPHYSPTPSPVEAVQTPPNPPRSRVEMLQISALISMPSHPHKSSLLGSMSPDDIPLPELVLGITKLPHRHKKSSPLPSPTVSA